MELLDWTDGGPRLIMAQTLEPNVLEPSTSRDAVYIGGTWVAPSGGEPIQVDSPSTEEVIGVVPRGSATEVDAAVRAARAAFPEWSQRPVAERAEFVERLGAALTAHVEPMARLI